jgi:adenosine deaminase
VSIGVSTDTRTITNISLNEEYRKLQETFGWEKDDFYQCNLNALNVAFIPENLRSHLINKLAVAYNQQL